MLQRIEAELALVRERYPNVEYREEGRWVHVPSYPLPDGWNRDVTPAAFQVNEGHPGAHPYGFYVPAGIQFQGAPPQNYTEPAKNAPPFEGVWGFFSWAPIDGTWQPTADVRVGSSLLSWIDSFRHRFVEGA